MPAQTAKAFSTAGGMPPSTGEKHRAMRWLAETLARPNKIKPGAVTSKQALPVLLRTANRLYPGKDNRGLAMSYWNAANSADASAMGVIEDFFGKMTDPGHLLQGAVSVATGNPDDIRKRIVEGDEGIGIFSRILYGMLGGSLLLLGLVMIYKGQGARQVVKQAYGSTVQTLKARRAA